MPIIKNIIGKVLFILIEKLINYNTINPVLRDIERLIIIFPKSLGIGDIIMLSPMIPIIKDKMDKKVIIFSKFPCLYDEYRDDWYNFKDINKYVGKNDLFIFPAPSISNSILILRLMANYVGFCHDFKVNSNLFKVKKTFSAPESQHYFKRAEVVLLAMFPELKFESHSSLDLPYPNIVRSNWNNNSDTKYMVVAPFGTWNSRQPSMATFIAEITRNLNDSRSILVIGASNKRERLYNEEFCLQKFPVQVHNLTGKTSIPQIMSILDRADCFIGSDGGASHFAAQSKCAKVVVLDGCVPFQLRKPLTENHVVSYNHALKCPFFPCYDGFHRPHCKNIDKFMCLPK